MNTILNHTIRKFNRFELKYLITLQQAENFKRALRSYMRTDEHGNDNGRYALASLYFDLPDLRCYWEKEYGIRYRRKLRLRRYETGEALTEETPIFLEIKQRVDRVTQKRRAVLPYKEALRLCNERQMPEYTPDDQDVIEEIYVFLWQYNLRPVSIVRYDRQAFIGSAYDLGLRVTFDTAMTFQAHPLHLHEVPQGLPMMPVNRVVMEVKVNERIPSWLTELIADHNLRVERISKYCRSIENAAEHASSAMAEITPGKRHGCPGFRPSNVPPCSEDDECAALIENHEKNYQILNYLTLETEMEIFNITDLTSEFTILDVVLVLALSFLTSAFIGWIYQQTHRGTSYTQSFVFTLVMNGMIVALVMMIVGSNIARAFSLVGALSIIRFRNAVKETRDVGFIFFTMAIGMAIGTQFYSLGIIGALVISLVVVLMTRLDWFAREMSNQILSVQVPNDTPYENIFDRAFLRYTTVSELISVGSVQNGTLTELVYSIGMKKSNQVQDFLAEIRKLNNDNKVTLIAGYNGTDL